MSVFESMEQRWNSKPVAKLREGVAALNFLRRLSEAGCIVSSNQCAAVEIAVAQSEKRTFVDNDGYGYVLLSPNDRGQA